MYFRYCVTTLILMLILLPLHAAGWNVTREENGIKVEQSSGSGYATTRATAVLDAVPDAVAALLGDTPVCTRWLADCRQGKVVDLINMTERVDYLVLDFPAPEADRDLYVYSLLSWNPVSKVVTVRMSGMENYDAGQPGRVRIREMNGSWVLQPVAGGKTRVTWQIYHNPGLKQADKANTYLSNNVFNTLTRLGKGVKEPKYHNARFTPAHYTAMAERNH
ncbi:MAG: hypothetical protein KDI15_07970 [Thiothrix sp.]|nr:hypothetical protein [Thiothrix sp.]HPE60894.1 START domain-containing protein [Thiolinea sp.]